MSEKRIITIAKGDGIGPEIMNATLDILNAANIDLEFEEIEIGEKVYNSGIKNGISENAWESLRKTKVFLKAPITTPQGGGFKSLNVTTRKTFSLYANVRPCISYSPFVTTNHPNMNMVIVRENEEDLYAGIEHRQTEDVYQCLKLVSRQGCERIIRYAFNYAIQNNRKKVTAISKDNIMKLTDGLFHKIFNEVAKEYPDIETEHYIVDIGAAKIANDPNRFDVIVTLNLYGDILSDIAAEITGSVGLAGSSNIGEEYAMFEAIHGSAPDIAGKGIANPSGLLLGAVMMLNHLNMSEKAELIHNAWLKTIEDGIHTGDIYNENTSKKLVNTDEFKNAVIERLGLRPQILPAVHYNKLEQITHKISERKESKKELVGVDIFLQWWNGTPVDLGNALAKCGTDKIQLKLITNRGQTVFPNYNSETYCVDHWRCRHVSNQPIKYEDVITLMENVTKSGFEIIKSENLYKFDGVDGFSSTHGG